MISLDQVLLLEEKVESAVAKIQQLEAENDALRNKCSELTNALSAKSEQLKSYESEQNKIESGIIKAIDRLNSIENSVLKAAGQSAEKPAAAGGLAAAASAVATAAAAAETEEPEPVEAEEAEEEAFEEAEVVEESAVEEETVEPVEADEPTETSVPAEEVNFDSMETVSEDETESTDELGFDIF